MSIAVVFQIISGIVGLITMLLKQRNPVYDTKQELRRAVVDSDVDTVQRTIDRVLAKTESDSPTGSQSDADTAKRLSDVLGTSVVSEQHGNDKAA